jgi:hypothetical protein
MSTGATTTAHAPLAPQKQKKDVRFSIYSPNPPAVLLPVARVDPAAQPTSATNTSTARAARALAKTRRPCQWVTATARGFVAATCRAAAAGGEASPCNGKLNEQPVQQQPRPVGSQELHPTSMPPEQSSICRRRLQKRRSTPHASRSSASGTAVKRHGESGADGRRGKKRREERR